VTQARALERLLMHGCISATRKLCKTCLMHIRAINGGVCNLLTFLNIETPAQTQPSAVQMKKVFFVGIQTLKPYRMALDQVYKFESASRVLSKETVQIVGNPADPILRIR